MYAGLTCDRMAVSKGVDGLGCSRIRVIMTNRVLVIEDDPRSARLLELVLASQGYATSVARSGDAGLELLRSCRFDALVLDLMLPGTDGIEVLRQIRDHSEVADLPVVITSARASPGIQEEAAALGVGAYLTKPYRKDDLLDVVRKLIGVPPHPVS